MDPFSPMGRPRRKTARSSLRAVRGRLVLLGTLLLLLVAVTIGVDLYTDWLWFSALGYLSVFVAVLRIQILLCLAGAALFAALFVVNAALARRIARSLEHTAQLEEEGLWAYIARVGGRLSESAAYERVVTRGLIVAGVLLSLTMGLGAASQWETVLLFASRQPFGVQDPLFHLDVGFFVFTLPLFRAVHAWALVALVLIVSTTLAIYAVIVVYQLGASLERVVFAMPRGIKAHLAAFAATAMLLIAANHVLEIFELVYSTRGVAFGAGYADVHAQLPALWAMAGTAVLAAALIIGTVFTRGVRLAAAGIGVWLVTSLVGGLVYPNLIENVEVKPNQLDKERPFIENSIAMTRQAYGLDRVQEQFFPAEDAVTPEEVRANPQTISNIRLWDHRPLLDTLNQIQSIRAYYTFEDVDVDRYVVNGEYRQVMLAARELNRDFLQQAASSWVNQRLKFTHGYGVAIALVSGVAEEGRPILVEQDIPPRGQLPLVRPEIYYGERGSSSYVLVKTSEQEFDYPSGDTNVETRYAGSGGVNIGGLVPRVAYALKFRDPNLLLSGAIQPDSEILYRRNVVERVQRLAPFLLLDRDPYVVVAGGQLFWMLDAYTVTDDYPYAEPRLCGVNRALGCYATRLRLNYIRNSVKVVVNAYDGSTRFYLADPSDPLALAYQRAFPGLFVPIEEMPPELRQHVRYPEDMFGIQADVYQTYHMTDATVFYNREDVWALANEKFDQTQQPVEPYYVIMRLPGEAREEFLLMLPFTPRGKDNMIAWLAARSDGEHYGTLLVYKYPKERLVYGPAQFESRIDQDPTISAQLSLWSQRGSRVIRGNTLVIPVGQSNLYVEPLYLQSESAKSALPELKQVIVSTGSRLVMEPTLEAALTRLFGPQATATLPSPGEQSAGHPPAPPPAEGTLPPPVIDLIRSANAHFERAQQALREGDWARYGEEQRLLQEDLRRLAEQANP